MFWVLAQRFEDVPERAQRSFLVSTALRVASDRKLSKWHRSVSGGLDMEAHVSEAPLPDEALDMRRAGALLDEALATLDEPERSVFVLAEIEQMTRAEVAEVLGIPEGTVASRLRRARESLDAALRIYFAARERSVIPIAEGGSCEVDCHNPHVAKVELDATWRTYQVRFSELRQRGAAKPGLNSRQLHSLAFLIRPEDTPYDVWLDDVRFLPR